MNNLYNNFPELRDEWDDDKNIKLFSYRSGFKASWKCKTGSSCHRWKSRICDRTKVNSAGCPYCSKPPKKICNCDTCPNLYNNFPELREEWDGCLEEMKNYTPSTNKVAYWKCKTGNNCHKWDATIASRTTKYKQSCPFCSKPSKRTCSCDTCPNLYNNFPELRKEWDGDIEKMKNYPSASHKKVLWKCKTANPCHKWLAKIANRTRENGTNNCPYCCHNPQIVCSCNECPNLYNLFPKLRDQWNGDIEEMKTYTFSSHTKVSWKCEKNHIWSAIINKNNPRGCPRCKYKTEEKLFGFLKYHFEDVKRQIGFSWIGLKRFDFLINSKIILELDGPQHFIQISNWMSPEETINNDINKMSLALNNGYPVIRIEQEDVFYNRNNWKNKLLMAFEEIEDKKVILLSNRYDYFFIV